MNFPFGDIFIELTSPRKLKWPITIFFIELINMQNPSIFYFYKIDFNKEIFLIQTKLLNFLHLNICNLKIFKTNLKLNEKL